MANTGTQLSPFGTASESEVATPLDPQALYTRNQTALEGGGEREMFPNFGAPLLVYSKHLMGEAFTFLSGVSIIVQPEKMLPEGGRIGEQETARVWVAVWDWEKHEYQPAKLASFTDYYLVNQLRGVEPERIINSGLYTVARNDRFRTTGGDAPRMLKRYVYGTDNPLNELRYQAEKAQRASQKNASIPADTKSLFGGRVPTDWTGPDGQLSRGEIEAQDEVRRKEQAEIARVRAIAAEDAGDVPWIAQDISAMRTPELQRESTPAKRGPGRPKGSGNKPK